MDHLEWSDRSAQPRLQVPYLAAEEDDSYLFDSFRILPEIEHCANLHPETLSQLASSAQKWLYFGTLKLLLRDAFSIDLFVEDDLVHTKNLQALVNQHVRKEQLGRNVGGQATLTEHGSIVKDALHRATSCFSLNTVGNIIRLEHENKGQPYTLWNSAAYRVLFSVSVLLDFLLHFVQSTNLMDSSGLRYQVNDFIKQTAGIGQTLAATGRCPSLLRRLRPPIADAYSLISFPSKDGENSHKHCSMDECKAYNIIESTYQTRHTADCRSPGCQFLGIDFQRLCSIVDQDCIPLVCSTIDDDDNLSIKIQPGTLDSHYTAISHVWAGGLGNLQGNSLPECQIRAIHLDVANGDNVAGSLQRTMGKPNLFVEAVGKLYPRLQSNKPKASRKLFWLDTLCIPVPVIGSGVSWSSERDLDMRRISAGPDCNPSQDEGRLNSSPHPESGENEVIHTDGCSLSQIAPVAVRSHVLAQRRKAINAMARIYGGATDVLVFDPELQEEDSKELKTFELSLAVTCCPWMARSWTLQEGGLALNLRLKFATEIKPYADIRRSSSYLSWSLVESIWTEDISNAVHPELPVSLPEYFLGVFFDLLSTPAATESHFASLEDHDLQRFCKVWNQLCERNITKVDDIAAILATLLNMSAGEILKLQPQQRMKALLKSQSLIPLSILLPASTRIDGCNFPPGFPNAATSTLKLSHAPAARVTDRGLVLENPPFWYIPEDLTNVDFPIFLRTPYQHAIQLNGLQRQTSSCSDITIGPLFIWASGDKDSAGNCLGRFFIGVQDDSDATHVKIGDSFRWRWESECPPPNYGERRRYYNAYTMPFRVPHHTAITPVVVDMDIKDWPELIWSRTKVFPFTRLGIGQLRLLNSIWLLALASWAPGLCLCFTNMFLVYFLRDTTEILGREDTPFRYNLLTLPVYLAAIYRSWIAVARETGLVRDEARWIQEMWAASFWDAQGSLTSIADDALQKAYPLFARRVLISQAIIGTVFGAGSVILFTRFEPAPREPWLHTVADWYQYSVILTFFKKSTTANAAMICLGVATEAYVRVVVMALYLLKWSSDSQNRTKDRRLGGMTAAHRVVQIVARIFYIVSMLLSAWVCFIGVKIITNNTPKYPGFICLGMGSVFGISLLVVGLRGGFFRIYKRFCQRYREWREPEGQIQLT